MAFGSVAFVELTDGQGTTYARWQSYWLDQAVTFLTQSWQYQQMDWAGVVSGVSTGEQASITVPATPSIRALVERALSGTWLAILTVYSCDEELADAGPPTEMILVGSAIGEVVAGGGGLTSITMQLGSALSPVGAQFPPRTMTTPMIGVPARLG